MPKKLNLFLGKHHGQFWFLNMIESNRLNIKAGYLLWFCCKMGNMLQSNVSIFLKQQTSLSVSECKNMD